LVGKHRNPDIISMPERFTDFLPQSILTAWIEPASASFRE
jgi:hypothetical protein